MNGRIMARDAASPDKDVAVKATGKALNVVAGFAIVTEQTVAYTGTAAQSAAVNAETTHVLLRSTTNAHFAQGANPTATTSNTPLFEQEYFPVPIAVTGGVTKISAIRASISGSLYITELKPA